MKLLEFIRRYSIGAYFSLAFIISWGGCFLAGGSKFLRGEPLDMTDAIYLFIPMLAGPSIAGLLMTGLVDGRSGLRQLFARMRKWRVGIPWYAALLIFPALILAVLMLLTLLVSKDFTPIFFPLGLIIGLFAGFFEEIGWTGYAFPKMQLKQGNLRAAIYLGLLHALWHLAADFFGSFSTRGEYWPLHFLFMMLASMTAMRILVVWVYANTRSVLLSQLMHASSTGFLAVFVSTTISPAQSTFFYMIYALALWLTAGFIVMKFGKSLVKDPQRETISVAV